MSTSAAWPVDLALEEAALKDETLVAIVGEVGWYSGRAPQGVAYPHVTNDDATEDEFQVFQGNSQVNVRVLSLWSKRSKSEVLVMYGALFNLLHKKTILLEGFGCIVGRLRLVTYVEEPDTNIHHGIAEYTVWTKANG